MRDEHFYTRALSLTSKPELMAEYYIGRAEWYYKEHQYDKAYQDFCSAKELGSDIENHWGFPICKDYINADDNIKELTERIKHTPDDYDLYCKRANFYLLKREYDKAVCDAVKAISLKPCPDTYKCLDKLTAKIRECNVHDAVYHSKKKDLIDAYKLRIELAIEKVKQGDNEDYWIKRAELDIDKIIEMSKDKTLALFLKVDFHGRIYNFDGAIRNCKRVIEQSENRTDKLGRALTYIYAQQLVFLYAHKEKFKEGMDVVLKYSDKPYYEDIKKGLKYIRSFSNIFVDILRKNCRTRFKYTKQRNKDG